MKPLRREIHPEIRVLDAVAGIVEYVASNETIDCYQEIVRADGWQFNRFAKNAPFVDSHNYESIDCLVGKVLDYQVKGKNLVETVKWAIDVPQNTLAQKGFAMTAAGYLKAVSVGFMPLRFATRWDNDATEFNEQCEELGLKPTDNVCCVHIEQDQLELSACIIGANPDAVARAYKAGIIDDAWLDKISAEKSKRETANPADGPAAAVLARQRAQQRFLLEYQFKIKQL